MLSSLLAGIVFAFVGSFHCAGMCGPLALALPVPESGRGAFIAGRLLYNAGRIVMYAALGVVVGLLGRTLAVAGWQQWASIALGVLILVTMLAPTLMNRFLGRISFLSVPYQRISGWAGRLLQRRSMGAMFLFGLLNGLLPCGFVYLALAAAATTGDVVPGAVFMAGFGGGTLPVMLGISLLGKTLRVEIRRRLASFAPVFGVILAVLFILRGLNLGIPYVSPHVEETPAHTEEVDCCH